MLGRLVTLGSESIPGCGLPSPVPLPWRGVQRLVAHGEPTIPEANGHRSVDVNGAKLDDQYKFVIGSAYGPSPLWKNDPYARELTQSKCNSIIADPNFVEDSTGYRTPAWNQTVFYELHVAVNRRVVISIP
jgi:1,4-alpha-glucan branching enzyme